MFWLRPIVKIAAIAGLSSVILVMLLGQPRIFFTMSKDGLLPPVFSKVHPKFKTPYISTIVTGSVAMVIAGILPISILGELVSIGTLLAFIIVCISVLVLRKSQTGYSQAVQDTMGSTGSDPGCSNLFFADGCPATRYMAKAYNLDGNWIRIYFFYGIKHSKVREENKG